MELGLVAIRRALGLIQPRVIADPLLAGAAVLIPIIESDSGPLLLFTRRTETVRYHKGQISFPGGAQDGTEPLESTALRETEEEIGVTPEKVEIIGRFHDYLSSSNYRVTPFVALISPDAQFVLNSGEVAYLITVPLRFFAENQPECRMMERRGRETAVYFYRKEDQVIWGLTARIVKEFVETVVQPMQQKTPRGR
jgi:8-oxo-dGTP pyrophosphatase MutT (NUDIX family)